MLTDSQVQFIIFADMIMKPFRSFFIAIILLGICSVLVKGATFDDFTAALNQVETGGRQGAILGDNGKALGPLQIHREYFDDSGTSGDYQRCAEYPFACDVVRNYLRRYAKKELKKRDWQACARIHNGGPRGHTRKTTIGYWKKVKTHLER